MSFTKDLRHALRGWLRSPGVLAIAVLSLGLGIGVATSIFTIANSLLFNRSSGLEQPERLVRIFTSSDEGPYGRSSYPDYEDLLTSSPATQAIAAGTHEPMMLGRGAGQAFPDVLIMMGNSHWVETLEVLHEFIPEPGSVSRFVGASAEM